MRDTNRHRTREIGKPRKNRKRKDRNPIISVKSIQIPGSRIESIGAGSTDGFG
jgi:hypothetical protein